jgi:hypothetical protein
LVLLVVNNLLLLEALRVQLVDFRLKILLCSQSTSDFRFKIRFFLFQLEQILICFEFLLNAINAGENNRKKKKKGKEKEKLKPVSTQIALCQS